MKKRKYLIISIIVIALITFYWYCNYTSKITMKLDDFPTVRKWEYIKKRGRIKGINRFTRCYLSYKADNSFDNCSIGLLNQKNTKLKHDLTDITMFIRKNYVEITKDLKEKGSTYDVNTSTYVDDEKIIKAVNRVCKNRIKIINNFEKNGRNIEQYEFITGGAGADRFKGSEWYLSKDNDFRKITKEDYKIKHNGVKVFLQFEDSDFTCINIFVEE